MKQNTYNFRVWDFLEKNRYIPIDLGNQNSRSQPFLDPTGKIGVVGVSPGSLEVFSGISKPVTPTFFQKTHPDFSWGLGMNI